MFLITLWFCAFYLQCFDTAGLGLWSVKIERWGVGVVICLERGADCLHMVQLMPLHPQTPSSRASFKSRLVLPFWYQLTQVVLEKRPLDMSAVNIRCCEKRWNNCYVKSQQLSSRAVVLQGPTKDTQPLSLPYCWQIPRLFKQETNGRTSQKQLHGVGRIKLQATVHAQQ